MGTPTGGAAWSLLTQQAWAGDDGGTKVWWKVAGGSEPASYGFTQSSSADGVVAIAAIHTAATSAPVFASSSSSTSATSIPTPSVTPTAADDLELRWAAMSIAGEELVTWTPPATYTERVDTQSREFTSGCLATKQLASGSATGIQNFTLSLSTSNHMGITVAVTSTFVTVPRPIVIGQAVQRAATW
jgi:hypothetical protein